MEGACGALVFAIEESLTGDGRRETCVVRRETGVVSGSLLSFQRDRGPRMQHLTIGLVLALTAAVTAVNSSTAQAQEQYEASSRGTRLLEGGNGFAIKMLVERSNVGGGEVEIGEITFPVGSGQSRRGHVHGTVEIFYVLSGELDHIVNDESHIRS